VVFSALFHWFFFLMVGLALLPFRNSDTPVTSTFKSPLYPWVPALFCLPTLFMLYASLAYAYELRHTEAFGIIIIMILGIAASFYDPEIVGN
jgi:L-asparagine transporter-like permease